MHQHLRRLNNTRTHLGVLAVDMGICAFLCGYSSGKPFQVRQVTENLSTGPENYLPNLDFILPLRDSSSPSGMQRLFSAETYPRLLPCFVSKHSRHE